MQHNSVAMNMNKFWLVEMLVKDEWLPTTGCAINKASSELSLSIWRENMPEQTFRLGEYEVKQVKKRTWAQAESEG